MVTKLILKNRHIWKGILLEWRIEMKKIIIRHGDFWSVYIRDTRYIHAHTSIQSVKCVAMTTVSIMTRIRKNNYHHGCWWRTRLTAMTDQNELSVFEYMTKPSTLMFTKETNIATDGLYLRLFWKISPFDEITVLKEE